MKLKKYGIPKKNLDKNDDFVYSILTGGAIPIKKSIFND
jgi:hypothetical protein